MGDLRPFGLAGRAGGIDHVGGAVTVAEATQDRIAQRRFIEPGFFARKAEVIDQQGGQCLGLLPRHRAQLRAGNPGHQLAIAHDKSEPITRVDRIEGNVAASRFDNGQHGDHQRGRPFKADPDPPAPPHTQPSQSRRKPGRVLRELAVAQRCLVVLHRRSAGIEARLRGEQFAQREVARIVGLRRVQLTQKLLALWPRQ